MKLTFAGRLALLAFAVIAIGSLMTWSNETVPMDGVHVPNNINGTQSTGGVTFVIAIACLGLVYARTPRAVVFAVFGSFLALVLGLVGVNQMLSRRNDFGDLASVSIEAGAPVVIAASGVALVTSAWNLMQLRRQSGSRPLPKPAAQEPTLAPDSYAVSAPPAARVGATAPAAAAKDDWYVPAKKNDWR
jgi:hypothetical protein